MADLSEYISQEGLNQFFHDVRENLDLMENSLLEIEEDEQAVEPRNSLLRAIHSIKGAAHMFGYEHMAQFCHLLEDVHIPVNKGELEADSQLISKTLRARDLLEQLMEGTLDDALYASVHQYFSDLAPERAAPVATTEEPVTTGMVQDFSIVFSFQRDKDIFNTATNPLWYLRSLRELGELRIQCQTHQVPLLGEIDPGVCYLQWKGHLVTKSSRAAIMDEFTFIEDDLAELVVEQEAQRTQESAVCLKQLQKKEVEPPRIPSEFIDERYLKILIVDDDFNNRMVLRGILQTFGDCDMVIDGSEATEIFEIALADGKPYDLVLLDIMMPVMDGYAALQRIRQLEQEYGVKPREETVVIMVTALDTPRSIFRAFYDSGCTDYVVKPVSRETIMNKLMQHGLVLNG
ncbi:MAG: response regulator [Magnetococcales bacterium]|nr:response regulator [Magnetococcales bacterium]NGZ27191.1 response regulator [Magnetococcales bacterium]